MGTDYYGSQIVGVRLFTLSYILSEEKNETRYDSHTGRPYQIGVTEKYLKIGKVRLPITSMGSIQSEEKLGGLSIFTPNFSLEADDVHKYGVLGELVTEANSYENDGWARYSNWAGLSTDIMACELRLRDLGIEQTPDLVVMLRINS